MGFQKGHAKVGGRCRGTPNQYSPDLRAMVIEAFHRAGGVDYLVRVAEERPAIFCRLLARLIPRQVMIVRPAGATLEELLVLAHHRRVELAPPAPACGSSPAPNDGTAIAD